ncbi:MAG: hypothetical protein OEY23_13825 [Acidimicrobiia bacterium]|nr:hypothetical protein [Acidimicrobiia bacterium]
MPSPAADDAAAAVTAAASRRHPANTTGLAPLGNGSAAANASAEPLGDGNTRRVPARSERKDDGASVNAPGVPRGWAAIAP